jgi:CubicO group peptidase (beta-lactamase class C family)
MELQLRIDRAVLRKATGKPLDQLARTMLFGPLGITDVEWYRYAQDNPSAAAGLRLRPRDLAKIGQLVLQHGAWNGKRLVSPRGSMRQQRRRLMGRASSSMATNFGSAAR